MVPPVSVILPVYNEGLYLERCLTTLKQQKIENIEICISDNASEDNTWDVIQDFQKSIHGIKAVRQYAPLHPYDNLCEAFKLSTGKAIIYFGGDDYLVPSGLSDALAALTQDTQSSGIVIRMDYFNDGDESVFASMPPPGIERNLNYSRKTFLNFLMNNINHDELIVGLFPRDAYAAALRLVGKTSIESVGIWLFLAIVLYKPQINPRVLITDRSLLMKRYGKPAIHSSKFSNSLSFQGRFISKYFERVFEFRKASGTVGNILRLYHAKLISLKEACYLMFSFRYHSDYGLFYLGPLLHPFWRLIRGWQYCYRTVKHNLSPKNSSPSRS